MQGDRPPRTNTRFVLGLSSSTAAKQDPCSRSGRTPVPSVGSRPIELGWYGWKASHNSGHFRLRIQLERGGEVIDSHIQKLCIAGRPYSNRLNGNELAVLQISRETHLGEMSIFRVVVAESSVQGSRKIREAREPQIEKDESREMVCRP